jgi:hypothetical protein
MDIDDPAAPPLAFATLAKGLSARVVTSGVAAPNLDMYDSSSMGAFMRKTRVALAAAHRLLRPARPTANG